VNIYVGNMSYAMDEKGLNELFSKYGEVSSARVIKDRGTGRSKGFAFVEMPNDAEGKKAIEDLDGSEYKGRNLRVNEAKPREERPER